MNTEAKGGMDIEMATKELDVWFNKKKIKESQKLAQKDAVDVLIESIKDGDLILNQETNELAYALQFPDALGDSEAIKVLKFRSRVNDVILKPYLVGNTPGNGSEIILSYLAALTNTNKSILAKLDTADKRVTSSIVVFFL